MRIRGSWFLLVMTLAVAGCSTGVTGPAQLATVVATQTDASADATSSPAGTAYDITNVTTRRIDNPTFGSYDTLRTEITFDAATPPVLPNAATFPTANTDLVFRVYFDTDQNAATGAWNNGFCGNPTGGSEFVVNATTAADTPVGLPASSGRLANGNYDVVDGTTKTGEASVSVAGNVLSVTVPLSALGGDNGITHLSVRVGNAADVTTDCAPETAGFIVTSQGGR